MPRTSEFSPFSYGQKRQLNEDLEDAVSLDFDDADVMDLAYGDDESGSNEFEDWINGVFGYVNGLYKQLSSMYTADEPTDTDSYIDIDIDNSDSSWESASSDWEETYPILPEVSSPIQKEVPPESSAGGDFTPLSDDVSDVSPSVPGVTTPGSPYPSVPVQQVPASPGRPRPVKLMVRRRILWDKVQRQVGSCWEDPSRKEDHN